MGSLVITKFLFVYWLTCCVTASQLSLKYADPHAEESPLSKADPQHDSIELDSSKSGWDFYPEREPQMVTPSTTNLDLSKPTYQVENRKVAIAEKVNSLKKIYQPGKWTNSILAAINNNRSYLSVSHDKHLEIPKMSGIVIPTERTTPSPVQATIIVIPSSSTANSGRNRVELTESKQIHQRREPGDRRNPETRFINNTSLIPPSSPDRDSTAVVPPPSPIKGNFAKIRPNENGGGYPYPRSRHMENPRITLRMIEPKRPILRGADATITIVPFPSTSNETRGKTEPNGNEQVKQMFEPGHWRNPERRFITNSSLRPPSSPDWDPNAIAPPPSPIKGKFAKIRPNENGGGYPYPRSRHMEKPRITLRMIEPKRPILRGADATITIVPFPSTTNETRGKTEPNGNGHVNQRLEPGDRRNPENRFINNSSLRPPSSPYRDPSAVVPPASPIKGKFARIRPNENGGGYLYPRSRQMEKPRITLRVIEPRRPISRGADATITIVPFPSTTNETRGKTEPNGNGHVNQRLEPGDWRNPEKRFINNSSFRPPSNPEWDRNAVVPPPSSSKGKFAEVRPNENGGEYPRSRDMEKPKITLRIIEPRRPISRGADATITIVPFPSTTNETRGKTEPNGNGHVNQRLEPGDWRNPEKRFINNTSLRPPSSPDWDPNAVVPPPSSSNGKFAEVRPNENGGEYPRSREMKKPKITLRIIEPRRPISRGADATITIVPFPSTTNETRGKTEPNGNGHVNQRLEPGDWRNPEKRFINNSSLRPPSSPDWDPNAVVPPPSSSKGKFAEVRPNGNGGEYPRSREMEKPKITLRIIEPRRPISRGADATITIIPFLKRTNSTEDGTERYRNGQVYPSPQSGGLKTPNPRTVHSTTGIVEPSLSTNGTIRNMEQQSFRDGSEIRTAAAARVSRNQPTSVGQDTIV